MLEVDVVDWCWSLVLEIGVGELGVGAWCWSLVLDIGVGTLC